MNQYSNSATRQLINLGGEFAHWVRDCVAALVDDLAGAPTNMTENQPMIFGGEDGLEIHHGKAGNEQNSVVRFNGPLHKLNAVLDGKGRRSFRLRIGNHRAVIKQIQLPDSAMDVIPAVVRNKVESLAPWPLDEVLWGYRTLDTSGKGHIDIEVGIVSRKSVDGLLGPIQSGGIEVSHLDIAETAGEPNGIDIDFRSPDRAKSSRRAVAGVMSVAMAATVAAALLGLYFAIATGIELADIQRRTAELNQAVLGELGGSANPKLSDANKLYEKKRNNLPAIAVINELSRQIPDGTWLNGIDYSGEKILITGRGMDVTNIVEKLEKSDVFADVGFAAATQRDDDLNIDIFSISAAIQAPRPGP